MGPALATLALLLADPASPIEGRWANPSGSVVVAIAPCGEAWCGRVVSASDQAKADAHKGGVAELVGTELLSAFVPNGDSKWRGKLFVPDLNKRVRAALHQVGPGQLKITGCAVGRVLCKSQLWVRTD